MLLLLWPHRYGTVVPPVIPPVGTPADYAPAPRTHLQGLISDKLRLKIGKIPNKRYVEQVYEERKDEVAKVVSKAKVEVNDALRVMPDSSTLNDARDLLNYLEQLPLSVPLDYGLINSYLEDPEIPLQLQALAALHQEHQKRSSGTRR